MTNEGGAGKGIEDPFSLFPAPQLFPDTILRLAFVVRRLPVSRASPALLPPGYGLYYPCISFGVSLGGGAWWPFC